MNFGLPYKGSKNTLAPGIVERLPSAGAFVDLFCGGCAVTHAAMLSGRWERYLINDICGIMPQCFLDAVHGKFRNETRWISHEEFNLDKGRFHITGRDGAFLLTDCKYHE
jgi:site-specific DNA-adenine methylase